MGEGSVTVSEDGRDEGDVGQAVHEEEPGGGIWGHVGDPCPGVVSPYSGQRCGAAVSECGFACQAVIDVRPREGGGSRGERFGVSGNAFRNPDFIHIPAERVCCSYRTPAYGVLLSKAEH